MASPKAIELHKSIKLARSYALESNYDAAVRFYEGLDSELLSHIHSLELEHHEDALMSKWEQLRVKLNEERSLILNLQEEWKALVDPAAGVRRDRGLLSGGSNNSSSQAPQPQQLRPVFQTANTAHGVHIPMNPLPYRDEERPVLQRTTPPPFDEHVEPLRNVRPAGVVQQPHQRTTPPPLDEDDYHVKEPVRTVRPAGVARTSSSPSATNQQLYGDKDRFGPSRYPSHDQQPQQVQPTAPTNHPHTRVAPPTKNKPVVLPTRDIKPPGKVTTTSSNSNKKAPLPKFVKRDAKTVSGGAQAGGDDNSNRPQRFVPRQGEEELASLIEADMSIGGNMDVTWDSIAGQKEAKELLEEAVVYPVLMPEYYQGPRRPWKGVLMYGPPGTGKTMLAKAVASQCGTTFFNISPATLTSKMRGDGEKLVRILFDMARHYAPSTIFIDEIDSLCGQRGGDGEHEASRRAKSVLLTQMDGVGVDSSKIVMLLGATNHPWDIDEAMRRRLEKRIYIPLPTNEDRISLFKITTKELKMSPDVDFDRLSQMLEHHHYSGADISNVVRDASLMTMRRFMGNVDRKQVIERAAEISKLLAEQPTKMEDFIAAVRKVPSSINPEQIKKFEEWKAEFETNI